MVPFELEAGDLFHLEGGVDFLEFSEPVEELGAEAPWELALSGESGADADREGGAHAHNYENVGIEPQDSSRAAVAYQDYHVAMRTSFWMLGVVPLRGRSNDGVAWHDMNVGVEPLESERAGVAHDDENVTT